MSDENSLGYWWLKASPKQWSFSNIAIGEEQAFTLRSEKGKKRRIYQNFLDAKNGDMVIGFESNPNNKIKAICRISKEQDGVNLYVEKVEDVTSPINSSTLRDCPELNNMEFFRYAQYGTLFKLTKDEYDFILNLIHRNNPERRNQPLEGNTNTDIHYKAIQENNPTPENVSWDTYSKNNFLNEVFMTESRYKSLVSVLLNKKNIILQGAPGVGKTFVARRLAWSLMGKKDNSRIAFIQFHQNYSYEDFMMGYKPVDNGFKLQKGIFYKFCQKAASQPNKDFFFIIDEINRGNMSKIFGELLMLIENDYRGEKATLAYNDQLFSVPPNLYIIGMMNTADRSLAMIDYALRRRFSFFEMEPAFDSERFIQYQNSLNSDNLNRLISTVKELNNVISSDSSLGKGFCIGHSYFCGKDSCNDEWLRSIIEFDILPLLQEYWFDEPNKVQHWENILRGVLR